MYIRKRKREIEWERVLTETYHHDHDYMLFHGAGGEGGGGKSMRARRLLSYLRESAKKPLPLPSEDLEMVPCSHCSQDL